jgi:branched-chain amino acid transport system substrate-binding protein
VITVKKKLIAVSAAAATVALLLAGCSSGATSSSTSGTPIVIGASLPLTGSLSGFGPVLKAGYQAAVDQVNKAGGIKVDGTRRKVKLIILDSTSDANTVTDQSKTLVLQDNAVGLLGSISPALTIPASNVAD